MGESMNQASLNFDYPEANLFPYGSQQRNLYEALTCGPVTNAEMRDQLRLLSYTRRLSDIREKLFPHGLTIRKEHQGNGVFVYSLERQAA